MLLRWRQRRRFWKVLADVACVGPVPPCQLPHLERLRFGRRNGDEESLFSVPAYMKKSSVRPSERQTPPRRRFTPTDPPPQRVARHERPTSALRIQEKRKKIQVNSVIRPLISLLMLDSRMNYKETLDYRRLCLSKELFSQISGKLAEDKTTMSEFGESRGSKNPP